MFHNRSYEFDLFRQIKSKRWMSIEVSGVPWQNHRLTISHWQHSREPAMKTNKESVCNGLDC